MMMTPPSAPAPVRGDLPLAMVSDAPRRPNPTRPTNDWGISWAYLNSLPPPRWWRALAWLCVPSWTLRLPGPGQRLLGTLDHLRKELAEVEADPGDVEEWCDILLLAMQGALRQGHSAQRLLGALHRKLTVVEGRDYPDWRTADPDKAIEHVRG